MLAYVYHVSNETKNIAKGKEHLTPTSTLCVGGGGGMRGCNTHEFFFLKWWPKWSAEKPKSWNGRWANCAGMLVWGEKITKNIMDKINTKVACPGLNSSYTGCERYSCAVYHSKNFMFLISLGIIFNGWRRVWLLEANTEKSNRQCTIFTPLFLETHNFREIFVPSAPARFSF